MSVSCWERLSPCVRASHESRAVTHLPARKDVLMANRTLHQQRLTEEAFTARHKLCVSHPEASKQSRFLPSSGRDAVRAWRAAGCPGSDSTASSSQSLCPENTRKDSPSGEKGKVSCLQDVSRGREKWGS